jgi:Na+-transporting NADH:ubiquinone oxidoreductase subunit NqrE
MTAGVRVATFKNGENPVLAALFRMLFALLGFLARCFAFAMSVHLPLIDSNCVIVQVTVGQLQGLRVVDFPL